MSYLFGVHQEQLQSAVYCPAQNAAIICEFTLFWVRYHAWNQTVVQRYSLLFNWWHCVVQIQAAGGDVTITNDGATILKQMQVLHPAAKMVNFMG